MTDHPGWVTTQHNQLQRVVVLQDSSVLGLTTKDGETWIEFTIEAQNTHIAPDVFTVNQSDCVHSPLKELLTNYRVLRWRNPNMWDSIALAIVRQVIRASQAAKLYRNCCTHLGEENSPGLHSFPDPETILRLSDEGFQELGLKFQMPKLRAAARRYLKDGSQWAHLSSEELYTTFLTVPGIGPWSASIAVVDYTNDFDFYPFDDLAVRSFARMLWPELNFSRSQLQFKKEWSEICKGETGLFTLLALALGAHFGSETARLLGRL
jgi:DNA-3-methyladenine glycosylase II